MPNRRAGAITGLMETSLPRRSRIWQVVKVLTPDRCLGKSKISRMRGLITRFFGHPAGGTEDARRCTMPHRIDMQGAGEHAPALGTTKFQPAALTQPSSRAYSSSITLSSSSIDDQPRCFPNRLPRDVRRIDLWANASTNLFFLPKDSSGSPTDISDYQSTQRPVVFHRVKTQLS